jgi:hypothetical protein
MLVIAIDYPLDRLVVGGIFLVAGFFVILCRKSNKEWSDDWNSKDFPIGSGNLWMGKYSKGRLSNATIILLGLMLLGAGAGFIISAFRG